MAIVNIPSFDGLNRSALRLYFAAWGALIDILYEFDKKFEPVSDELAGEWKEYIEACQSDLQSICSSIQQSSELALKAKICQVSPFLLLSTDATKFGKRPKGDVDFFTLKTLDSSELPAAVNTLCAKPLGTKFVQTYDDFRTERNKIIHLGRCGRTFLPGELLDILVKQYLELWSDRPWLNDRVTFASQTRRAFLQDGKYESPHMDVMHELPFTFLFFSKSEFKRLFGHDKSVRRFLCHACIDDANTRHAELDLDECKTAFLNAERNSIHCVMCGQDYRVSISRCIDVNCKGTLISDNNDKYVGKCHVCGTNCRDPDRAARMADMKKFVESIVGPEIE